VPRSWISLLLMTRIWSASRSCLGRCAITKLVRPSIRRRIASWMCFFGSSIDAAGRLVEDENGRVGENGPGNREHLPLSIAEIAAAFGTGPCRNLWESMNEGIGVCLLCRLGDPFEGVIGFTHRDVVFDRGAEENGFLQGYADMTT